ncbi:MAG TPA: PIN domain-containing protein [Stellaceae bacterium]|nr:PIN domain-containing protein [Stellaceae bacterium]
MSRSPVAPEVRPLRLGRSPPAHPGHRDLRRRTDRAGEAVRECRDPKDDKYLALALAGSADVIVSSDVRHLLAMHPRRGMPILSPRDFLARADELIE